MTFSRVTSALPFTRRDIRLVNELTKPLVKTLRPYHRKCMDRLFLRGLSSSEYVALSAITSRTLGWAKLIEIIPLEVFKGGVFAEASDFDHLLDEDDFPVFVGTGLDKGTLRTALNGLFAKGLIGRFAVESFGREVFAYMPLSVRSLCYFVAAECPEALADLPPALKDIERVSLSDLEERFIASRSAKVSDLLG